MNKAIYKPKGKAGEYAEWACNLYVGCSNDCSYCYCKRGVLGTVMGQPKATLKKCFQDEIHAFEMFVNEVSRNADAIRQEGGIFFSFTTDPMLPETIDLTMMCVNLAAGMKIPCQILTKRADWTVAPEEVPGYAGCKKLFIEALKPIKDYVSIGFTLTGYDLMEPHASFTYHRIEAMRRLHDAGIKTFASIEPVITFEKAEECIKEAAPYCDIFKIGLMSGNKDFYNEYKFPEDLEDFVNKTNTFLSSKDIPVFWKKTVADVLGYAPEGPTVVGREFSLFNK